MTVVPTISGQPNFDFTRYVSYVDEAGHSKDPRRKCLCLAGLLATEISWKAFDAEWRAACIEEGLTRSFHMKDLSSFKGEFESWTEEQRRRLLAKLILAIRHANAIPIGSVVSVEDFNALSVSQKDALKDPYFVAFQQLTYQIAVAAAMHIPPGRVTMMYARHPEHSRGVGSTKELWEAVQKYNPIIASFMHSYQCGEPIEHSPLQAADLWAYELGHHFEVIRPARKAPRWPFKQFVEIGLNYKFTHDFITYHDATGINGLGRMSQVQRWREISLYQPEPEPASTNR
jgi:hypothetical protein